MKKYTRDGFPGMNYERRPKREERQSSSSERGVTASRRERQLDFRARESELGRGGERTRLLRFESEGVSAKLNYDSLS